MLFATVGWKASAQSVGLLGGNDFQVIYEVGEAYISMPFKMDGAVYPYAGSSVNNIYEFDVYFSIWSPVPQAYPADPSVFGYNGDFDLYWTFNLNPTTVIPWVNKSLDAEVQWFNKNTGEWGVIPIKVHFQTPPPPAGWGWNNGEW